MPATMPMTAWGVKPELLCLGAGGAEGRTCGGEDVDWAIERVVCGRVIDCDSLATIVVAALRMEMYITIVD